MCESSLRPDTCHKPRHCRGALEAFAAHPSIIEDSDTMNGRVLRVTYQPFQTFDQLGSSRGWTDEEATLSS